MAGQSGSRFDCVYIYQILIVDGGIRVVPYVWPGLALSRAETIQFVRKGVPTIGRIGVVEAA